MGERCARLPWYHDTEWGFPIDDDGRLFEKARLETFQSRIWAGEPFWLSAKTFVGAFQHFDFKKVVAILVTKTLKALLDNKGNRGEQRKILAVIKPTPKRALEMIEKRRFSLAASLALRTRPKAHFPPPETQNDLVEGSSPV